MGKASRNKRLQKRLPGKSNKAMAARPRTSRFAHIFGPDLLRAFGPFFFASWWVPAALAQNLSSAGKPIPPPVMGVIVIDTGADGTCISKEVADRLGLIPKRMQPGFGAGGECDNPVYFAQFSLKITENGAGGKPIETNLVWEQETLGVPNLGRRKIKVGNQEMEVIGLLGRDVLQHCRMVYDGLGGVIQVEFDLTAMKLSPSQ